MTDLSKVADAVKAVNVSSNILATAWQWVKQYWFVILLFLVLVVGGYVIFTRGKSMTTLMEDQRQQINDTHAQIEELESAVDRERLAREELQRTFNERINEIDARYTREIETIRKERARRIRELANNPQELDRQLDERFGLAH